MRAMFRNTKTTPAQDAVIDALCGLIVLHDLSAQDVLYALSAHYRAHCSEEQRAVMDKAVEVARSRTSEVADLMLDPYDAFVVESDYTDNTVFTSIWVKVNLKKSGD